MLHSELGSGSDTAPLAVVVTGASSGIGKQTALAYASRGVRLVLASRSLKRLERVAEECRAAGALEVLVQATDIAEQAQVDALIEVAVARLGGVDLVVQCAAVAAFGRFSDVPTEVFDAVIRTNVCGAANVARSALAHFSGRGRGQLVLVGSLLGQVAVPYMSPYVVSKFAVSALVRVLRQEHRDQVGVAIHGIYPGAVNGPIYGSSANYSGYMARVPPYISEEPSVIARAILGATDRGRPSERSMGPVNWPIIIAYKLFPVVFDAIIGPAMRMSGFTQELVGATTGNLFSRRPERPTGSRRGERNPADPDRRVPVTMVVDAQP